jgi:hypothetical protein
MYFHGPPKEPDHPGSSVNTMASLEFKTFKALNVAKFEEIIVRDSGAFFGRMDAREEGDDPDSTETLNVSTILSQATHYIMKFKTAFVALFDYNTLILLVMKNTQTVQPKTETTKAKAGGYGGDVRIFLPPPPKSPCQCVLYVLHTIYHHPSDQLLSKDVLTSRGLMSLHI